MKRSVLSDRDDTSSSGGAERRPIKRSNSSLFSIATLVDVVDNDNTTDISRLMDGGGAKSPKGLLLDDDNNNDDNSNEEEEEVDNDVIQHSSSFLPINCSNNDDGGGNDDATTTMPDDAISSSCSSSDVEQQPDATTVAGDNIICIGKMAAGIQQHTSNKSLPDIIKGDNRTGLIFEAGSKHFDRHNRMHKERAIRVTAVQDYLLAKAKSKVYDNEKTIYERCQLLQSHARDDVDRREESNSKTPEELYLDDHDYLRVHLPGYMQR